jgi:hypothetical protein
MLNTLSYTFNSNLLVIKTHLKKLLNNYLAHADILNVIRAINIICIVYTSTACSSIL